MNIDKESLKPTDEVVRLIDALTLAYDDALRHEKYDIATIIRYECHKLLFGSRVLIACESSLNLRPELS